jgi:hypothetical protein
MLWTKAPFPAPSGAPTIRQVVASTDILPDLLRRTLVAAHQVTDGREVGTGQLSAEASGILLGQADPPIRSRRALVGGEHSMSHPHMHERRRDLKPVRRFRGRDQAITSHRDGSRFDRTRGGNSVLLAQAGHSPSRPGFAGILPSLIQRRSASQATSSSLCRWEPVQPDRSMAASAPNTVERASAIASGASRFS